MIHFKCPSCGSDMSYPLVQYGFTEDIQMECSGCVELVAFKVVRQGGKLSLTGLRIADKKTEGFPKLALPTGRSKALEGGYHE